MQEAIIGLVGAVIGAVAATCGTIWVTRKQLLLGFDKTRIEILQAQVEKLETLLIKFSEINVIHAPEERLTQAQLGSKYLERFIAKENLAKPYFHYLKKNLGDEVTRAQNAVSSLIVRFKSSNVDVEARDETESQKVLGEINTAIEDMKAAESRLESEIAISLRVLQSEIQVLASRKHFESQQRLWPPWETQDDTEDSTS